MEPYPVELDEANAEAIVMGADVVVDCTDSFETRYLVNDACCAQGVPLVEAGVVAFEGLVLSIRPGRVGLLPLRVPGPAAARGRGAAAARPGCSAPWRASSARSRRSRR